jgi:hypothetical protein
VPGRSTAASSGTKNPRGGAARAMIGFGREDGADRVHGCVGAALAEYTASLTSEGRPLRTPMP